MNRIVLRLLLILTLSAVLAGCKLAVIVVEGGEVYSDSVGHCLAGSVCILEVTDTSFSDTLTALPDRGWSFVKWNNGTSFHCGGATNPECVVDLDRLGQIEIVRKLIQSSEVFYVMPVFREGKNTIRLGEREWLQPARFNGFTWNEIEAVCPTSSGICDGELNSNDMKGWTWASVEDVNALFNHYAGRNKLGPGPDFYEDENGGFKTAWANDFYADGWLTTMSSNIKNRTTEGWTRDRAEGNHAYWAWIVDTLRPSEPGLSGPSTDYIGTNAHRSLDSSIRGSWFYRDL